MHPGVEAGRKALETRESLRQQSMRGTSVFRMGKDIDYIHALGTVAKDTRTPSLTGTIS